MPNDMDVLKTELSSDPLAVGYSGMDDAAAAVSLNDTGAGRTVVVRMESVDLYEAIDVTEFAALTTEQQRSVDRILGLSMIDVSPGSKARSVLVDLFPGGSVSRAAIVAAATQAISRATELGLGEVKVGHVATARA